MGGGKPRKEWKTPGGAQATRQQWVAGQDRVHRRKQETLVAPPTDGLDVPTGAGMAAAAAPRAQASTTTWRAAASPTGGAGGGSSRGRHGESVDPAGGTRAAAAGRRQRRSASAGAWASAGVGVPSAAPSMVDVRAGGAREGLVLKKTLYGQPSRAGADGMALAGGRRSPPAVAMLPARPRPGMQTSTARRSPAPRADWLCMQVGLRPVPLDPPRTCLRTEQFVPSSCLSHGKSNRVAHTMWAPLLVLGALCVCTLRFS